MFWTKEKLEQRIQELNRWRYREEILLDVWLKRNEEQPINGIGEAPLITDGEHFIRDETWKGRDVYIWLQREVSVAAEWAGRRTVLLVDFGKTGEGNNSGFEAMLYINGRPYHGIDGNHKEVLLPKDCCGSTLQLNILLWSGLEGGGNPMEQEHRFKRASLAWIDETVDNLYYTAKAALHTSVLLDEGNPHKQELLKTVDRAFRKLDWSSPGSEAFYTSVDNSNKFLANAVLRWKSVEHPVTISCIGHTHIDIAWLWRLTHTREKAARSFSTVLRLMEQYPEYTFLQTMPQIYAYIKQDYPDIYDQIRQRVKEGRWEAGGAMWLEADCNLTSGESLVRQILHGTRFFREEFGVENTFLWLPDVFGYSWALPQILKKSGIDTFMTTKISWNQFNRMPHDTFIWRGIDGSEVLTHFITTPDLPGSGNAFYTYSGVIEPFTVKGIWDAYQDKNINTELLLAYGFGDGGGGVNRDMLETRRRLEEMPGLPRVVTSRADDYFARLLETVKASDQYVHTWDGELYLEFHRGTYTSQAYNKRMNRKLELAYREAEWMQVLKSVNVTSLDAYPRDTFHAGWTILLRNQFHDIIPGSSIAEVYADSRLEYVEAKRLCDELWTDAAISLRTDSPNTEANDQLRAVYTIYNSASFACSGLVNIPFKEKKGQWYGEDGVELNSTYKDGEWKVQVPEVLPMGCMLVQYRNSENEEEKGQSPFHFHNGRLETPLYIIEWNQQGHLTRIYDRQAEREVLAPGEAGNVLQVFEDKPLNFDAWDIDLFYLESKVVIDTLEDVQLITCGPLTAEVSFRWRYHNSVIEQVLVVYAQNRRIDFVTMVDWQERQQLLKVAFPVAIRATEATYDIQFGNVKRPTHWNTSWDYARYETVGHQWVDLSERRYGVSLLNDCKYGHDIKDNVIRLSLIKSAISPDPEADKGHHDFTYSLYPHTGDWVEGGTVQAAWALNNPLSVTAGASLACGKSLLKVDNDHILIDAVKAAEDSDRVVIRLHEFTGARVRFWLSSDYEVRFWQECDLMERACGPVQRSKGIELEMGPYEIRTLMLELSGLEL